MIKILITRSQQENIELKGQIEAELKKYKISCIIENSPLIKYHELKIKDKIIEDYNFFVITSKFAAKMLATKIASMKPSTRAKFTNKEKKIFVVGDVSAKILSKEGANPIEIAPSATKLTNILENFDQIGIYLSGDNITTNMPENIKREIIYNVEYKKFDNDFYSNFSNIQFDFVLIYSVNCAKVFLKNCALGKIQKNFYNTSFIAISHQVAQILQDQFKNVFYPKTQDYSSQMIKLIPKIYLAKPSLPTSSPD